MAKVLLKNSFTATSVPAGLSAGELAVNVTDRKLFVGNAVGGVVTLIDPNALVTSFNGSTGAVTGVTAGATAPFTATTLTIGGLATTLTLGASGGGGTTHLRNLYTKLGTSTAVLTTSGGTANSLTFNPSGNLVLAPVTTAASSGGTNTSLTITNTNDGVGTATVAGGDLVLGTKNTDEFTRSAVNIIFEGSVDDTFETTLTVTNPTADRTITLPDATGTLALLGANTYTGLQTFSAGITSTTLYASAGVTFNSTSAHTGLATFNAGISASGATFSGNITAPNIVTGISGATGPINLVAGTNITIAQSGKTFTFSSSGGGTQVGVTSSGQLFDVDTWAFSYCDFHGGPGPFGTVLGACGGDVVYYVDSPGAHLFSNYQKYTGVASLITGASGSYVALGCVTPSASYSTAVGPFSMGLTFEFRTRISTDYGNDSTATNNFTIYAGVDEQVALYPTFNTNNGAAVWFEYNHASNSGNWTANLCEYFGRTASVGTTFAYTNTDNKFDIIRGMSGGVGHFFMYINGVNVAGFSFSQGLLGQGQGNARIVVRRTAAVSSVTRRTFVDYLSILQQRGT